MSKTVIRYWAYDRCLQNHSIKYTWVDLHKAANQHLEDAGYQPIKKTQFYEDMKALKAPPYNAPIVTYKEGGQSYFRYSDPAYSLRKQDLSQVEAEQVKSALMILGRFKGLPQFEWVHELIPKIEQTFKLGERSAEIICFEQNVDLKGIGYLGQLFNAILFKKVLTIKYKSFTKNEVVDQTIHPYYLKQYNNRWFLFGRNPNFESVTNLALDRIEEKIHEIAEPYIENTDINFDEYFEDIIGVTKPQDKTVEKVKLWFSLSQAPYVHTKPLHGTQKEKWDENGLTISLEVIPNVELEQLILRYGESCKVLEPVDLNLRIQKRLESALDNY